MSAIPSPALILTRAFDRLELSGARVLHAAATGDEDLGPALVDTIEAKTQAKAAMALVRLSDEMMKALLDIGRRG